MAGVLKNRGIKERLRCIENTITHFRRLVVLEAPHPERERCVISHEKSALQATVIRFWNSVYSYIQLGTARAPFAFAHDLK